MNRVAIVSALAMATGLPAWAQSEVEYAKPKSDAQNYLGDRINYGVPLHLKSVKLGTATTEDVCVASETGLRGIGTAKLVDANGKELDRVLFRVGDTEAKHLASCGKAAPAGTTVAIDPDLLATVPPNRRGWSYGTLIVPYKYQFKGDRSLSGGATLGGYLGYRNTVLGTSTQAIFFAGATKVDVPKLVDGKATTEQLAGLSYGVGVLSNFKQAFQVGLVVGADRVTKSANYANNGKPWVSLSLGYAFIQ